jgi:stage II sporulation protein P
MYVSFLFFSIILPIEFLILSFQAHTYTRLKEGVDSLIYIQNIKIRKLVLILFLVVCFVFLLSSLFVTAMKNTKSFDINQLLRSLSLDGFMMALEKENHYFAQNYFKENKRESLSSLALSMTTNIQFDDIRSLIRTELPGYRDFHLGILMAEKGTDFTNMPEETDVPMEELAKERVVDTEIIQKAKENSQSPTASPPIQTTNGKKVAYIYHSHSRESFLPLLPGAKHPDEASSPTANISLVGERLKNKLEERGIGALQDKTDITQLLLDKKLKYPSSYKMSRQVVQAAMKNNNDIEYLIDIHRDNARKDKTTVEINGKKYAKLYFIVGVENKNYQNNLDLATSINSELNKKYKGISRGIFPKDRKQGNGIYNQDLSPNSLLIEIGGVDNTLDEVYRTVDALAEIISEHYWKDSKVNN